MREGDVLLGKYRVGGLLGAGGMSVVMSATHLGLDEQVALKFLRSDALESSDALQRFSREARAGAKIKSEHVARIIDVAATDSGVPFIVMEHLEGRDLEDVVARSGPIAVETAAVWVIQACSALAEAHERGVIHRDLKPANLFLTQRTDGSDCIKILDFGISRILAADGASLGKTRANSLLGSPVYMSPEQMSSAKTVDARADVWALGTILFELVTGTAPFDAPTLPEVCVRVVQDAPVHPRALRSDLPVEFESIILQCLEKDPEHRFQSVSDLALALCAFAPASPAPTVRSVPPPSMTIEILPPIDPGEPTIDGTFASAHPSAPTRSRTFLVAASGVLVAGAALSALLLANRARDGPSPVALPERAAHAVPASPVTVAQVLTPDAPSPVLCSEAAATPPTRLGVRTPAAPTPAAAASGTRSASKSVTGVHLFDDRK